MFHINCNSPDLIKDRSVFDLYQKIECFEVPSTRHLFTISGPLRLVRI